MTLPNKLKANKRGNYIIRFTENNSGKTYDCIGWRGKAVIKTARYFRETYGCNPEIVTVADKTAIKYLVEQCL